MAVHQKHFARLPEDLVGEGGQCAVIGHIDLIDSLARLGEINAAAIDVLTLGDDARNGAETPATRGDPLLTYPGRSPENMRGSSS